MKLMPAPAQAIRRRIHTHMGQHARICLFGLRVDNSHRGGDVDLYVGPETAPDLTARLRCKSELADALDINFDLIVQQPGQGLPIYRIAKRKQPAICDGRNNYDAQLLRTRGVETSPSVADNMQVLVTGAAGFRL